MKLLLSILVFSSLYLMTQSTACSQGTTLPGASEAACKLTGLGAPSGGNCAAATDATTQCTPWGSSGLCSGGDALVHCLQPACSHGTANSYTTQATCVNKGFTWSGTTCGASTACDTTVGPFTGLLCGTATSTNQAHCIAYPTQALCNAAKYIWDNSACREAIDTTECWKIGFTAQSTIGQAACGTAFTSTTCPINNGTLFNTTSTPLCKPLVEQACQIKGYKIGGDGYCAPFASQAECDTTFGTGLFTFSAAAGTCFPASDIGCFINGFLHDGGSACQLHTTNCDTWPGGLFTFSVGKCLPSSSTVAAAACATLGLKASGAVCAKATGLTDCPVSNAIVTSYSSSKCLALKAASCLVQGLKFSGTSSTVCQAATLSSQCPIDDLQFFVLTNGICIPQQAAACTAIGLAFIAGTPNSCGLITLQSKCPIESANMWILSATELRCTANHYKACLHFGLSLSGSYCTTYGSVACNNLLTSSYFALTSAKLCLPISKEACLTQQMIYTDNSTACHAIYTTTQCQALNPDFKLYETTTGTYDFGCVSTSTDTNEKIRDCLSIGFISGTTKCEWASNNALDTTIYNSLLYVKNAATYLIYPIENMTQACQQYKLGYLSPTDFCFKIKDASTCKQQGLIWVEKYGYDDLSINSCKGKLTTSIRFPLNATECTSVGDYYYTSDSTIKVGSNAYTCIKKSDCGTAKYVFENVCYSSCSGVPGAVTTTALPSGVTNCAKCSTGCKTCTSETNTTTCQTCLSGFYQVSTNNSCVACSIGNCLLCNSAISCSSCKPGYKIYNNGTTDSCVSCIDFLTGCNTCDLDTAGKPTKCSLCSESPILNTDNTISKCVCEQYAAVATLRTSIENPTTPYISTYLISYETFLGFYYQIKCKWIDTLPSNCDATSPITDATKDLAILNQILTQMTVIVGQTTKSLTDAGFDKIKNIPSLISLYLSTPLSKGIDSATINKAFAILNNPYINSTSSTLDSYVAAVNALLLKASSNYVDFSASIISSIASMNNIMAFETNNVQTLTKDVITFDAYVFQFAKPTGIQAGVNFDITGSNATYFDGKVTDMNKAKVLASRVNLAKVTKASSINTTVTSEQVQFSFGQVIGTTDPITNITKYSFSPIDALTIPTKSCATFNIKLKTDYVLTDKSKVIYIAQWDDTKKIWDVNALTTTTPVAQPYTGCAKSFAQPFIVTEAKKKGSFSNLLAISFGLIASLFLLF